MHIIFGDASAKELAEKHPVVELDTFRFGADGPVHTAFCVIENTPIQDLPNIDAMRSLHSNLMINYRKRDWNFCTQAIDQLMGYWGKELDSFYLDLIERIRGFETTPPSDDWDGIVLKPEQS